MKWMPGVRRQRLDHHAGATAGVEAEPVDHTRVANRLLVAIGSFEDRQLRGRLELQHRLDPLAALFENPGTGNLHLGAFGGEGVLDRFDGAVVRKRLFEVVVGTHLDRLDRGLRRSVAGHHDHHRVRIDIPQGLKRLEAVPVRQPDIEEDHVRPLFAEQMQGLFAAGCHRGPISLVAENLRQGGENSGLVVNDQNEFIHGCASLQGRCVCGQARAFDFGIRSLRLGTLSPVTCPGRSWRLEP